MAKGKYEEWLTVDKLIVLRGWAREGCTDEELAQRIGIAPSTLYEWKKRYSEISEALKSGKDFFDYQVEEALIKTALGMTVTDKSYKMVKIDPDVLGVKRKEYENRYKLDNPEATREEIKDAAIKAIPTMERIQLFENTREIPPNVSAMIFWLKNRQEKWRDKPEDGELFKAQLEKAQAEAEILRNKASKLSDDKQQNELLEALVNPSISKQDVIDID